MGEQGIDQPGVFQIDQTAGGLPALAWTRLNARTGIERLVFGHLQQVFEPVAGEGIRPSAQGGLGLEPRAAERGPLWLPQMAQVGVEDQDVGLGARLLAMPLDTSRELDERAHGRGFDHGPVEIPVTPDFAHRRGEHHKEVFVLRMRSQPLLHKGQRKHLLRLAAIAGLVELVLDGRTQGQRKGGMVHTEMDAKALWRAQPVQRPGRIDEGIDMGHAHHAKADPLT